MTHTIRLWRVYKADYKNIVHVKTLVLDVLSAHSPPLPELAVSLCELDGLNKVDVTLVEIDEKTESLKVTINGSDIDFDALKERIVKHGAVVHSVDQVIVEK